MKLFSSAVISILILAGLASADFNQHQYDDTSHGINASSTTVKLNSTSHLRYRRHMEELTADEEYHEPRGDDKVDYRVRRFAGEAKTLFENFGGSAILLGIMLTLGFFMLCVIFPIV